MSVDLTLIAARLDAIVANATCTSCKATQAFCTELFHRPDNDAPFGCCSACSHPVRPDAIIRLAGEVGRGDVRTVAETYPAPKPKPDGMSWWELLNQDEQWKPNGKPLVAITDMDETWRYNTIRFLERRAKKLALTYTFEEAARLDHMFGSGMGPSETTMDALLGELDRDAQERTLHPVRWLRSTPLYRALAAGLPQCSAALDVIAEKAKHWAGCPARDGASECRCEQIRAERETTQVEVSAC
jgi:hypothetical protein